MRFRRGERGSFEGRSLAFVFFVARLFFVSTASSSSPRVADLGARGVSAL